MPRDNLKEGSAEGKALFQAFGHLAEGHTPENVISAGMNLVLNAIRQSTARRHEAIAKMAELHGRSMEALMEHYDPVTNRRRSVVPFDQVISASHVSFPSVIHGVGRGGKNGSS